MTGQKKEATTVLGKRSLQDRVPSPSSISISSPPSTPSTPKSKRVAGDGEKGHDGQAARPDITRISTLVDSVSTSSLPSLPRANATLPPKPSFAAIPALASSSSHVLPRRDVSYWSSRAPAAFQQPSQIASFSYDEQRTLFHDDRAMRYYHPPPSASLLESYANANPYGPGTGARTRMGARAGVQNRGADLNRGFENFKQRDESVNEHLDSLLSALMHKAKQSKDSPGAAPATAAADPDSDRKRAGLITWRGIVTKLCTALHEESQGFELNAMMVRDTLYLEEYVSPDSKADKARQQSDERLRRFGYYGYSFESWCSSDKPTRHVTDDAWGGDVNTNVQWCSVVKTKLGDSRLVIGGEVDCVRPADNSPVELKTSMQIRNMRDEERFEKKMLRFYMQSFLLGIPTVVVGFRDHKGFLVTHQEFNTLELPRAVRGKPHAWDPHASLNFASEIISFLRRTISSASVGAYTQHAAPSPPSSAPSSAPPAPIQPSANEAETSYPVWRVSLSLSATSGGEVKLRLLTEQETVEQVKDGKVEGRCGFLTKGYYAWAVDRGRV